MSTLKAAEYQKGKCRVSFYHESYQYRDSIEFNLDNEHYLTSFEAIKLTGTTILNKDAQESTPTGTYWMTFSFEETINGKPRFTEDPEQRVRIKKD